MSGCGSTVSRLTELQRREDLPLVAEFSEDLLLGNRDHFQTGLTLLIDGIGSQLR